ncbi:16S rRNA (uracil(1498)-N(3))-methyltransferase [Oceanicoccus sagamiensis]|uniref:Ribosomal RNA small subunit methyltransferase E n=1 Tax=Oceanicoccus sagamiensis TaxID=716816 RepID=A0A1X9N6I0_9GAMM|nr:16S rRNA (uracil(1498)-N(3))-methyltransferase [Oceanicoccus sagamiensis]ARN73710.1 16S rRNA (uracil(1498)-N(3))-methyltransferase [Oceanicoccus sagamiensis]
MRISRIYLHSALSSHSLVTLAEKPSHYISKVLRLKAGAELLVFNGDGSQYPAVIEEAGKKSVTIRTAEGKYIDNESPLSIHLGIAISKGDRMELVIQKATELGVTAITPLTSERTEVKLKGERLEKKLQHWQHIAISACEQCGRNQIPVVNNLSTADDWVKTVDAEKKLVLHHRTEQALDASLSIRSSALLVGPEGGLSQREIVEAEQQGFIPLQLGPRVLRTETAPLAAITLLQHIWGDM